VEQEGCRSSRKAVGCRGNRAKEGLKGLTSKDNRLAKFDWYFELDIVTDF